jgi:hypothetical protein
MLSKVDPKDVCFACSKEAVNEEVKREKDQQWTCNACKLTKLLHSVPYDNPETLLERNQHRFTSVSSNDEFQEPSVTYQSAVSFAEIITEMKKSVKVQEELLDENERLKRQIEEMKASQSPTSDILKPQEAAAFTETLKASIYSAKIELEQRWNDVMQKRMNLIEQRNLNFTSDTPLRNENNIALVSIEPTHSVSLPPTGETSLRNKENAESSNYESTCHTAVTSDLDNVATSITQGFFEKLP